MFQVVSLSVSLTIHAGVLIGMSLLSAAQAQTAASDAAAHPPCVTSAGIDGKLFARQWGMIASPAPFDRVEGHDQHVATNPGARAGLNILALTGGPSAPSTGGDVQGNAGSVLRFVQGEDTVTHSCMIKVIDFDPRVHDVSMLQFGDCNLEVRQGFPTLLAGHMQVYDFPKNLDEVSPNRGLAIEARRFSLQSALVIGSAQGFGTFVWISDRSGGVSASGNAEFSKVTGVCPLAVKSAEEYFALNGIDEAQICQDEAGMPVRLVAGQTATLTSYNEIRSYRTRERIVIGDETVAKVVSLDEANKTVTVKGLWPGTTSILLRQADEAEGRICTILVE